MPTGIPKNRNQTKTIDGRKPAIVWLQPKASRAYSAEMPTISQNPWIKKAKSTALIHATCFAFISYSFFVTFDNILQASAKTCRQVDTQRLNSTLVIAISISYCHHPSCKTSTWIVPTCFVWIDLEGSIVDLLQRSADYLDMRSLLAMRIRKGVMGSIGINSLQMNTNNLLILGRSIHRRCFSEEVSSILIAFHPAPSR